MSSAVHREAARHLLRKDRQEDLCFALWYPSLGRSRTSALVSELILPRDGDRLVHGNASFLPQYFERGLQKAAAAGAGLALLHSHPGSHGWQGMSDDDVRAEQGNAAAVRATTSLPFLGLTLAGDQSWSARLWDKIQPRTYVRRECTHLRVVGEQLLPSFNDVLSPMPRFREHLRRTLSAWGEMAQADLARLHLGIVGAGSVGALIAEALARTGIGRITLIDFDRVEIVNLDRLLHATAADVGRSKVDVLAAALRRSATAEAFTVSPLAYSVGEEEGFRAALDCDVLFSCVDRPWARSVLNFIAYAHLIPVVDGGIAVKVTRQGRLRAADWRAHIAGPTRRCLACLEQYDPALVAAEREGHFDDPRYIEGLPDDHPIRRNENVFAFSMATASLQVLQALSMIVAPLGIWNPGEQMHHFTTGRLDVVPPRGCESTCPYPPMTGHGDRTGFVVTGIHRRAAEARKHRPEGRRDG
ncbi:MAG TPA: ThiF family adenylyltransferase, partial [Vicinamibacterales bacterium]|nr:ThiF family adenylyltransferase [Vicinamibacterales bacterium]